MEGLGDYYSLVKAYLGAAFFIEYKKYKSIQKPISWKPLHYATLKPLRVATNISAWHLCYIVLLPLETTKHSKSALTFSRKCAKSFGSR